MVTKEREGYMSIRRITPEEARERKAKAFAQIERGSICRTGYYGSFKFYLVTRKEGESFFGIELTKEARESIMTLGQVPTFDVLVSYADMVCLTIIC